jgi:hypothetical protein
LSCADTATANIRSVNIKKCFFICLSIEVIYEKLPLVRSL